MGPITPPLRPLGREAECDRLDQLVAAVGQRQSSALVLRGEAGIGKTVLLDYVEQAASASGRVLRARGFESEMELPFAGLHQLCLPVLELTQQLPEPQRDAIEVAFGLRGAGPADRLMVALAGLTLLSAAADTEPLLCLIDDAQWLDQPSIQALLFIARRLLAEPIGLVLAIRGDTGAFAGLAELDVDGLHDTDALHLLGSVVRGRLDPRVSRRILAETHGNPLAITELPRGLSAAELGAGLGPSAGLPLARRIEQSFRRRYEQLPPTAQRLLLLASAEPLGDPALLRRAAAELGLPDHAVTDAHLNGLMSIGLHVQFQHPLVRSAIYSAATGREQQETHRAIAMATDPETDPDRRAWHRSQAATGPDEQLAAELEATSERARARGGLAASAVILEQAALLSATPAQSVRRGVAAARATYEAGSPERALSLVAILEAASLGVFERATVTRLRGQIAVSLGRPQDATTLLMDAAVALAALDPAMARETFLETLEAATWAGRSGPAGGLPEVATEVIRFLPPAPDEPGVVDHLLEGMLTWATDGLPRALPTMRLALGELSSVTADPVAAARWAWLAYHIVNSTWDDEYWLAMTERYRTSVREAGALRLLPKALLGSASFALYTGDFTAADTLLDDAVSISAEGGLGPVASSFRALLTAWRGQTAETGAILARINRSGSASGEEDDRVAGGRSYDAGRNFSDYCTAVLGNGLGNYAAAYAAARTSAYDKQLGLPELLLPELIEAALHLGERDEAERALDHLTARTEASGTSWALGIEAYCRALLAHRDTAEALYEQAIGHLNSCRIVPFRHRAHLIFGEWLRRERRRVQARDHLRTAFEAFTVMGAAGFAERARRELLATGGTVALRTEQTHDALTPQELQVARLAAGNASNHEIAAQLFISPSTVGYHLSKAFRKLDINSRRQLAGALGSSWSSSSRSRR